MLQSQCDIYYSNNVIMLLYKCDICYPIYQPLRSGQDMTQGQFLSEV